MRIGELPITAVVLAAVAMFGGALWAYGAALPEWTDAERAGVMFWNSCTVDGRVVDGWWRPHDELRTWRNPLIDSGRGLILSALTLGLLRLLAGTRLPVLRTPARIWPFFALGTAATIGVFGAALVSLTLDFQRQVFPPCADSLGIPFVGLAILFLPALAVLGAFGWLLSCRFGSLPTSLLTWDADRPVRSWCWTVVFAVAGLFQLAAFFETLCTSMFAAVPSCIIGVYLLAATRAALLAPKLAN